MHRKLYRLVVVVIAFSALSGCGRPSPLAAKPFAAATACSGNANGNWIGPAGAKLSLGADCTIRFEAAPTCESEGSYTAMMGTTGVTTVTILSREGNALGCPAPGRFQCAFIAAGGLTLNCGGGTVAYTQIH